MSRHTLTTLSADGSTAAIDLKNSASSRDNIVRLVAQGTFGGGTVTFETSEDGSTYISVGSDGVFTANGQVNIYINCASPTRQSPATTIRATIAGSTTPTVVCYVIDAL